MLQKFYEGFLQCLKNDNMKASSNEVVLKCLENVIKASRDVSLMFEDLLQCLTNKMTYSINTNVMRSP